MAKKKCDHRSFWEIYKIINFNRTFNAADWIDFNCEKCKNTCNVKWKGYRKMRNHPVKMAFTYFLWLIPAIILIYLVGTGKMHALTGIGLITTFHLGAMIYVINSKRLKITKK